MEERSGSIQTLELSRGGTLGIEATEYAGGSNLCAKWTEQQRAIVAEELKHLLSDPAFKHSARCSTLLRGLVERALAGNFEGIKERTLGVEIFGRQPSYDTNADPIVRMTANEIRKRLAQYCQQTDRQTAVRIRLVPGSYLPEFDFELSDRPVDNRGEDTRASAASAPESSITAVAPAEAGEMLSAGTPSSPDIAGEGKAKQTVSLLHRKWVWSSAALLVAIAVSVAIANSDRFRSTQYLLWKPLLESKTALFICISDDNQLQQGIGGEQGQRIADIIATRKLPPSVDSGNSRAASWGDLIAAEGVSTWLAQRGKPTIARPSSALTLWEFRRQPAILIGSVDNPWSLILLSDLRFSVRVDPAAQTVWIQDAQNPNKRDWLEDLRNSGNTHYDYALITRFLNPETGTWILAVAGLEPNGTMAASQFLTDTITNSLIPPGVRTSRNFQIVIRVNEISGKVSIPQVVAFHTW